MKQRATLEIIMILCLGIWGCALFGPVSEDIPEPVPEPAKEFPSLALIVKIYITDLGTEYAADLVKEKIRLQLTKSKRFLVVETPEDADAILTGVAGVERSFIGSGGNLYTQFAGNGILRLVDAKSKETIWTFEYERGPLSPGESVSTRVADQVIDKLLEDTTNADKKMQEQIRGNEKKQKL